MHLQLGTGFEEGLVHRAESSHLGDLLDAGQVLRLGRVDQQDPESQAEVDYWSHKGQVQEEADHVLLLHP